MWFNLFGGSGFDLFISEFYIDRMSRLSLLFKNANLPQMVKSADILAAHSEYPENYSDDCYFEK